MEVLYRPGVQNAEAVFAPSDMHLRLNLAIDTPFVSGWSSCPYHLEQLVASQGARGGAESLLAQYDREIGLAVDARKLKRIRCRKLVSGVSPVVGNIHPVHAQPIVVGSLLLEVVVIPKGMHRFTRVAARMASCRERINAGIGVDVMIVLEQS